MSYVVKLTDTWTGRTCYMTVDDELLIEEWRTGCYSCDCTRLQEWQAYRHDSLGEGWNERDVIDNCPENPSGRFRIWEIVDQDGTAYKDGLVSKVCIHEATWREYQKSLAALDQPEDSDGDDQSDDTDGSWKADLDAREK